MPSVSAVLLAAGESRRMGRPKALLDFGGRALIAFQVENLLEAGTAEVIVVLGHMAADVAPLVPVSPAVRVIVNPDYLKGKSTSVRAGLARLSAASQAVLILGVDQPRSRETLAAIIAAHLRSGAAITVPVSGGRRGHPVVFTAALLPELREIGDSPPGVRAVVNAHAGDVGEIATPEEVLLDINTPDDYRRALALFGYRPAALPE